MTKPCQIHCGNDSSELRVHDALSYAERHCDCPILVGMIINFSMASQSNPETRNSDALPKKTSG